MRFKMPSTRSNAAPSLLQLNDDVLALIVSHLHLYQQFELCQLHSRLTNIVQTLWRTRVRDVVLHKSMFMPTPPAAQRFVEFMLALKPYMQRLCLDQLEVSQLRLLSAHSWPGVQRVEWLGQRNRRKRRQRFVDEDVRLLQSVFPRLRTLKLHGCHVSGKYLCEFSQLNELSLDDCQFLESEYFRDIFRQLRLRKFDIMANCDEVNCCDLIDVQLCPTLEHVKIADYHLCMETDITQQLLRLPALHKLSIYSKNFVFDVLERIARHNANGGKFIEAFCFRGNLHNYERFFREVGQLSQLRRLALQSYAGLDMEMELECIGDQMLLQLSKQLTELNELRFCGCKLESHRGLLNVVANCRQLRLLDVTRSKRIGDTFVWQCSELLAKQKWRTQPLELWIRESDIDPDITQNPRFVPNEQLLRIDAKRQTQHAEHLTGVLNFTFQPICN